MLLQVFSFLVLFVVVVLAWFVYTFSPSLLWLLVGVLFTLVLVGFVSWTAFRWEAYPC